MKKLLLCVVIAIASCIFSSCEKSEDGQFRKSDFVGTWRNGSIKHVLSSGGSLYTDWCYYGGNRNDTSSGEWYYNKKQNTLSLQYSGYNGASYVFVVQSVSNDRIVLLSIGDHEGTYSAGTYTFHRQ